MSGDLAELEAAFRTYVGAGAACRATADELLGRYRQPHRVYHGVRHLVWVVRHVQSLVAEPSVDVADLGATIAAAFYHDAVYEPTGTANEAHSADIAVGDLSALGWEQARCSRVAELVRATADHVPGDAADAAVLCDADLAVLATEPADYEAYVTGVRREYAHVDDDGWRMGRAAVLRSFEERVQIYTTAPANHRWESRARANLAAELAQLSV
ncbi:MAG: hypothetical protein M3337_03395 [Actinomycetota bacterium]|nr:hypothetical protein [Actinomycetota bacterium]